MSWNFRKKQKKIIVEIYSVEIDLVPLAQEALDLPQCKLKMDAHELAIWSQKHFTIPRIRKCDVPDPHDWQHLQAMSDYVGALANWQYRRNQLLDRM